MEAAKEKFSAKKTLLAGIITENPVLVSLLGMCSTLATTKSLEAAFGMGILVMLTLIGSNVLISLLRKVIPAEAKIPCYIVIIATFVTIIKMLCQAFVPALYSGLGVFIALIVVNCIILGRAEAFASKNGVLPSFIDAIGTGIGFTMALCIMGIIREILGTGAITIGAYFPIHEVVIQIIPSKYAISLFTLPAGGFLTLGCILAFLAWRKNRKEAKLEAEKKARIEELKAKKAAEVAAKKAEAEAKAKAEAEAKAKAEAEAKAQAEAKPQEEAPKAEEAKPAEAPKEEPKAPEENKDDLPKPEVKEAA